MSFQSTDITRFVPFKAITLVYLISCTFTCYKYLGQSVQNPEMKVGPLSSDRTSTETMVLKSCAGEPRVWKEMRMWGMIFGKKLRGKIRDPEWVCGLL